MGRQEGGACAEVWTETLSILTTMTLLVSRIDSSFTTKMLQAMGAKSRKIKSFWQLYQNIMLPKAFTFFSIRNEGRILPRHKNISNVFTTIVQIQKQKECYKAGLSGKETIKATYVF